MSLDVEQIEHAVLAEIICLHPTHLTRSELALAMGERRERMGNHALEDSIWALKRFGLVRENGEVLEPTLTALRAAEIFQRA